MPLTVGKAHWLRRAASPWLRAGALFFGLGALGMGAGAQDGPILSDPVEHLDFDAPESWAMKYFSSASLLTTLGAVPAREAGEIELALEGIWVPSLSEDQRRVGFGGFKVEDLNRSEVFGRLRAAFGVGGRTSIVVGVVPPVDADGLEATLVSLAVERPFFDRGRWTAGWRLFGQTGEANGDLTCTATDARAAPGSPGNLFGCLEPSRDEVTLEHVGLELKAGYRPGERWTLHVGAAVAEHDLEFQVDAFTFSVHDRSLLLAEGTTWALDSGISIPAGDRTQIGIEVLWSPLEVVRPPKTSTENDDLLHLKAVLRYRVR